MVYDLDDRIRAYAEHLDVATPRVTVGTVRGIVERRNAPRRLTAAAVAAGLVVVALAVVVVFNPLGSEAPVVQQPVISSTTAASQLTPDTEAGAPDNPGVVSPPTTEAVPPEAVAISWDRVESEVLGGIGDQAIRDVIAGDSGLVAVGWDGSDGDVDAAVWHSVDGSSWTRVAHDQAVFGGPGDQYMMAVAVGGPGFVAVGEEASEDGTGIAVVWVSEDGITWSRVPHDGMALGGAEQTNVFMKDITAFGSGVVAVGMDSTGGSVDAAAWMSADGMIWERVPPDEAVFGGPQAQVMWAVVPAGPGLVAVGQGGDGAGSAGPGQPAAVWTSTDGRNWSRVPDQAALLSGYPVGGPDSGDWARMDDVIVGGPGFVAVGRIGRCPETAPCTEDAAIWVSADGVTWERSTIEEAVGISFDRIFGVGTLGDALIAVGSGRDAGMTWGPAVVWSSTDGGHAWERELSAAAFGKMNEGPNAIFAAVEFESRLIAVGNWESDAAVWIATTDE